MMTIVIPLYNEEKRIYKSIKQILEYLNKRKYIYEIIVVDDGSRDNSVNIVKQIGNKNIKVIKNKENMGKGYSVRVGILKAKYPLVLFCDSDLATPIRELDKFMKYIKNYDIIIGSRNMKKSKIIVKQPIYRQLMGKIFSLLVRLIVLNDFKDSQCGFKLFKTQVAKKIFKLQKFNRFSFDIEVLFIAKKFGYKIKEVPVVWIDKEDSKVNLIRDSIQMFIDLFRIKINNFRGKYQGEYS